MPALPTEFAATSYATPEFSVDMWCSGRPSLMPNEVPPVARAYGAPDLIGDDAR